MSTPQHEDVRHKTTLATLAALLAAAALPALGRSISVVHVFGGAGDGSNPTPGPLRAIGSTLYGTTRYGGNNFNGVVYSVTPGGSETVLHLFGGGSDGYWPNPLSVVGGTIFGTTSDTNTRHCNPNVCGTIFSLAPSGADYDTDYTFKPKFGSYPDSSLLASGAGLFGTAAQGGTAGYGTLFRYHPGGPAHVVVTFQGGSDGAYPGGNLTFYQDLIYGTTASGGSSNNSGIIYSTTLQGRKTVLHAFSGNDGSYPNGGLVELHGTLYGTAVNGGDTSVHYGTGGGTALSITPDGTFTLLHVFEGVPDGELPNGDLIVLGGKLYGTTEFGGTADGGCGTVFSMTTAGAVTVLASLPCSNSGPVLPNSGLTLLDGVLYGTTVDGGDEDNDGTVYAFTPSRHSF